MRVMVVVMGGDGCNGDGDGGKGGASCSGDWMIEVKG